MKNFFVSCAYIYPLCPLNINHTKMFVIADVIARNERRKGNNVFFPVASHYSGNSAQKISEIFFKIFSRKNKVNNEEEQKLLHLYQDFYKVPISTLKTFVDPLNILEFYNKEILWELKSLGVSCEYENFYTTGHKDFSAFANAPIFFYKKNNLLIKNKSGDLALDYNNKIWKRDVIDLINQTEFIQSFHKKNIISATKDVRNDWGLLRKNGFGAIYKGKWIIDPMFDSEIFAIFDLYIKFKDEYELINAKKFFIELLKVLGGKYKSKNVLINKIINFLPCDILICEEHLKNWVVKKFYTENLLFDKKYQTKKYFILGMGFLNGKQMSASGGHAILTKDLIDFYGPIKARLIILLSGGHPSKMYNYDKTLPIQADKLLNNFINHYWCLISALRKDAVKIKEIKKNLPIGSVGIDIEDNIEKGYYRQAIIELLSILPKEYNKFPTIKTAYLLMSIYNKYLDILLPNMLDKFISRNDVTF